MEYVVIIGMLAVGIVVGLVEIADSLFWVMLVGTLLCWIIAEIFRSKKLFTTAVFAGAVTIILGVVLLLGKWIFPWL